MVNNQTLPGQIFTKSRQPSLTHKWLMFFVVVFLFSFFPVNVQAGEVTLAWDPPTGEYEGFILSYGSSNGSYSHNQDIGSKTTHTVTNLDAGQTYFFAVKSYWDAHKEESPYSNQVNATVPVLDTTPPSSPSSLQIISGG